MPSRFAFVVVVAVAANLCACARQPAKPHEKQLRGAERALEALGPLPHTDRPAEPALPGCAPDASTAPDQAPARELMQRIDRYASDGRTGTDAEREWFALYAALRTVSVNAAPKVEDPRTGTSLSVLSLVAVLPEPAHWPVMRDTAKRLAKHPARQDHANDEHMSAIALGLLFDALLNDTVAQEKSLRELHTAATVASAERREQAEPIIAEWRERLAREDGSYDPIVEATRQLDEAKPDVECCTWLDALLAEAGETRAKAFLEHALFERKIALGFDPSERLLSLAQALVKDRPERLARVQWGLVGGARTLEFFYAMAALADCREHGLCARAPPDFDRALQLAPRFVRARLLRPLIEAGEDEHAERLLVEASEASMVSFALEDDLQRMVDQGHGQRALDFERFLLARNPSSPYWSSLDAFARATDQRFATQAWELLARAPATAPGLEQSRTRLGRSIASVPGTGDDVAATAQRLQRRLALPVATVRSLTYDDDPHLARAEAAEQLAELGLLEQRQDWSRQGLDVLEALLAQTRGEAYGKDRYHGDFARNRALEATVRLLRGADRSADAERLLFDELAAIGATCRATDHDGCRDRFANRYAGAYTDTAARLLVAAYADEGRDGDARRLVDRYPLWLADDAAELSISSCDCRAHPALPVARSLAASGDAEPASRLLRQVLRGYSGAPEPARLLGRVAGAGAADEVLRESSPERGMRLAIAALAAAGAGDVRRAGQLALDARAERLYAPWRGALDAVLGDAAAAAGDDAAAARWREGAQAQALAARANRYAGIGVTSRADAAYEAALAKQQPGDCIESDMLASARNRGDHAKVRALLRRMAVAAGADASGGALGCLRGYLSLTPDEYAVLRPTLEAAATGSPGIAAMLPTVIDELDADCTLSSSVDLDRVCISPVQRAADTRAAYAAAKAWAERDPGDADAFVRLYEFTRLGAFPSLYGGHMDSPPAAPGVHVAAAERDGWALQLMRRLPTRVPTRITREIGGYHSFWSPVTLLADYWRAAFEAAQRSPPPVKLPAYPLAGSREYQDSPDAGSPGHASSAAPPDPAVRAGLAIGSTEIIMTAARLIEPGVHDPCTTCL